VSDWLRPRLPVVRWKRKDMPSPASRFVHAKPSPPPLLFHW
jgi:hypothetical protein